MRSVRTQVAIAGAGLAGMALALRLAREGRRVLLLERRSRPGGAVHTLHGPDGDMDNSVHLFLAAFTRCRDLLDKLGSSHELRPLAPVAEVVDGKARHRLPLGAGWLGTLGALLAMGPGPALGLGMGVLRLLGGEEPAPGQHGARWLQERGIASISFAGRFWREWATSVFNAPVEELDAGLFHRTAHRLFTHPRQQAPLVAATTLERLWIQPLERALREAGVEFAGACPVLGVERQGHRLRAWLTRELRVEADAFVWAAPPEDLGATPGLEEVAPRFPPRREGRHIVNLRLSVEGELKAGTLRGWFGEDLQWLFPASDGRLVLVGSAWTEAHLAQRGSLEASLPRLLARHGLRVAGPARWLVQRHATPLQSPAHEAARPGPATALENLWCCGAWLATGLPASMESALASAELTHQALNRPGDPDVGFWRSRPPV